MWACAVNVWIQTLPSILAEVFIAYCFSVIDNQSLANIVHMCTHKFGIEVQPIDLCMCSWHQGRSRSLHSDRILGLSRSLKRHGQIQLLCHVQDLIQLYVTCFTCWSTPSRRTCTYPRAGTIPTILTVRLTDSYWNRCMCSIKQVRSLLSLTFITSLSCPCCGTATLSWLYTCSIIGTLWLTHSWNIHSWMDSAVMIQSGIPDWQVLPCHSVVQLQLLGPMQVPPFIQSLKHVSVGQHNI